MFRTGEGCAGGGMGRGGAQILRGPTGGLAESGGRVEGPVGVAQQLAAEEDKVCLALGDDGIGLGGIGDEADGGGGNVGLATDSGGKLDLKTGSGGNFGVGDLASGGDIDEIDAVFAQE